MIAALDVHYREAGAKAVMLLLDDWDAIEPAAVTERWIADVAAYEPGAFYKRELPCLLPFLEPGLLATLDAIVVDGYVFLGEGRPGLGAHLYKAINSLVPVIGVAKTRFHGCEQVAVPVRRGKSSNPLWITAIGIEVTIAAADIGRMSGPDRIPALLRQLDQKTKAG